jgi:hypothetical protein
MVLVSNVYGNDEFNSEWFKAFNDVLNVNVHTHYRNVLR